MRSLCNRFCITNHRVGALSFDENHLRWSYFVFYVLNIAYNVGAFSPTLFTMLVVMALVTTMSTTPILNLLGIKNEDTQAERSKRLEATAA